ILIDIVIIIFGKIFEDANLAQWISGVLILLAIPCVAVAGLVWADIKGALADNGFGLCNGKDKTLKEAEPLTVWLADRLDALAGIKNGDPLTFGDLWAAQPGGGRRNLTGPAMPNVLDEDPNVNDYVPLPDNKLREIN